MLSKTSLTAGLALALIARAQAGGGACVDSVPITEGEIASLLDSRVFTVGGQIGDLGGDLDFELFAGFGDATFAATKQYDWPNQEFVPFCLSYNALLDQFDYEIGGLQFSLVGRGPVNELFICTKTDGDASTFMWALKLELDGCMLDADSLSIGVHEPQDCIRLTNGGFCDGFELCGVVKFAWNGTPPTGDEMGFQIIGGRTDESPCGPGISFCNGDGGDQMGCTDCKCGNNAPVGTIGGCLNSVGDSAAIEATGLARLTNDTLRFTLSGGVPNAFAILVSGNNALPAMGICLPGSGIVTPTKNDGLRCVGGALVRHGTRQIDATGMVGGGGPAWGGSDAPASGLLAQGAFAAGQTRQFQVFYRDDPEAVCEEGQNSSNAIAVSVLP